MTRSWDEVRRHYERYRQPEMLALVNSILASPYLLGLFPWTSHLELNIAQTPVEYSYLGPRLTVLPLANSHMELRYVDTHMREKQWHRSVRSADAYARLEGFFAELSWFADYQQVSGPERRETK